MESKSDQTNRAGKRWTEEEQHKLYSLIEIKSMEDVAMELGRTVGAVKSRLLREAYFLVSQGGWTAKELSVKFKLQESEIVRYKEREDEKIINPPDKRVTRSQAVDDRSFSSVTKGKPMTVPNEIIKNLKPIKTSNPQIKVQTYEEQSLGLLTEIRDLLRIIASK